MPQMTGRFTSGPNKGRRWEVYPDDRSPSGYVRKIWSPTDDSNAGRPTEYFENYDFQSDQEDEQAASGKAARKAADRAQRQAQDDADAANLRAAKGSQYQYRDKLFTEDTRRFDVGEERLSRADQNRVDEVKKRLKEQRYEYDRTFGQNEAERAEKARQFNLTHELDTRAADLADRKLGADLLGTAASLRGANDLVQGWGYARGVQNAGLSPYVQAIQSGTTVPYGGGTAVQGHPVPATLSTLAQSMGAGAPQPASGTDAFGRPTLPPQQQAYVDAVSKNIQGGVANNPLGFFENMSDPERKGYFSAAGWLGDDAEALDTAYKRSRPGQGKYY